MTRRDITAGARFDDGIARSAYFIDIHDPTGPGGLHSVGGVVRSGFEVSRYYEIPYRSLVAHGLGNVLVACRAISTDHFAHAATRVIATVMSVGEAAGLGIATAKKRGIQAADVNGAEVRSQVGYLDAPLAF